MIINAICEPSEGYMINILEHVVRVTELDAAHLIQLFHLIIR